MGTTDPLNPQIFHQSSDGTLIPLATSGPAFEAHRREQTAARAKRIADQVAERQKQQAEHAARQEEARLEHGREALETYRGRCRASFLSAGGSNGEFEAAWPEMRKRYLIDQATAGKGRDLLVEANREKLRATGAYTSF